MSIDGRLGDGKGTGKTAHLHQRNGDVGLVVFSDDLHVVQSQLTPFLNPDFGADMSINAGFSGTPSGVHNGTDTVLWTASVIQGSWTFDTTSNPDTGTMCIDATSTSDGDEALFTSPAIINMDNFTAFTARVRLEKWGTGVKNIFVRFRLGGIDVGNAIGIGSFLDTGLLDEYQSIAISKTTLGIEGEDIDEMVIETSRDSGDTPQYRLDNMQVEESGSPTEFILEAPAQTKFLVDTVIFNFIDAIDTTLVNNSVPNLSYNQILAVPELAFGINLQRIVDGEIVFSASARSLGDFLKGGGILRNLIADATNACITVAINFSPPTILDSRNRDMLKLSLVMILVDSSHLQPPQSATRKKLLDISEIVRYNVE